MLGESRSRRENGIEKLTSIVGFELDDETAKRVDEVVLNLWVVSLRLIAVGHRPATLICLPDRRQGGSALLHNLPGERVARILGGYRKYMGRDRPAWPTSEIKGSDLSFIPGSSIDHKLAHTQTKVLLKSVAGGVVGHLF